MNKLVYLHELDSVRNSEYEIQRGQQAMYEEIVLNGNTVVLSFNQFADSKTFLCGITNKKQSEYIVELFKRGYLKVSNYKIPKGDGFEEIRTVSKYMQNAISKALAKNNQKEIGEEKNNESYEEDESDSHISDNDNNNNHRNNNKGNNGSSSLSKSHSNTSSGVEEIKNVALSARTKHKRKTKFGTFIQPAQPSVIKVNKPPPDDTYYNVSMLNIKLLIYNFERNAIVECPIIHRYSKVEQIIKGYGEGNDFHCYPEGKEK